MMLPGIGDYKEPEYKGYLWDDFPTEEDDDEEGEEE